MFNTQKRPTKLDPRRVNQDLLMQMIRAIIQFREDWVASSGELPVRHSTIEYVSDDPIDEVGRVRIVPHVDGRFVSVNSTS